MKISDSKENPTSGLNKLLANIKKEYDGEFVHLSVRTNLNESIIKRLINGSFNETEFHIKEWMSCEQLSFDATKESDEFYKKIENELNVYSEKKQVENSNTNTTSIKDPFDEDIVDIYNAYK
jgi:hypothetical protein